MIIRDMRREDYDSVDSLMQQLHKLHVTARPDLFADMEHPYSQEEFEQKVEDKETISILAEENGTVLGICFAAMRNRTCMVNRRSAFMNDLCVAEEARRQGIARQLFLAAEDKARELGAERLDLTVWGFNETALKFYQSLGMKVQRYIFEKPL